LDDRISESVRRVLTAAEPSDVGLILLAESENYGRGSKWWVKAEYAFNEMLFGFPDVVGITETYRYGPWAEKDGTAASGRAAGFLTQLAGGLGVSGVLSAARGATVVEASPVLAGASERGMSFAARRLMVAGRTADHVALRTQTAAVLRQARASGLTDDLLDSLRVKGASLGWAEEAQLVRLTGRGTRSWSAAELMELTQKGKVAGYSPHHINSVLEHEWLAGKANNIEIVERYIEHGLRHGGNTQNPTAGPLINRSQMMIDWLLQQ
jgi:hypothetical protein